MYLLLVYYWFHMYGRMMCMLMCMHVYIYVGTCVCMHMQMYIHLCVHVCKGSRLKLGVFLDFSPFYLLNPELASTN